MERKKNPSAFIRNTHDILQRDDLSEIISWAQDGKGFIIKNLQKFEGQILPQYFKHKKYTSFVRQLNMYGFHKQRHAYSQNYFKHQQFKKGQILLAEIKRKPQKKKLDSNLQQINNNILLEDNNPQENTPNDQQSIILNVSQKIIKQNQILMKLNSYFREEALIIKQKNKQILMEEENQNQDKLQQLENQQKKNLTILTDILNEQIKNLNILLTKQ